MQEFHRQLLSQLQSCFQGFCNVYWRLESFRGWGQDFRCIAGLVPGGGSFFWLICHFLLPGLFRFALRALKYPLPCSRNPSSSSTWVEVEGWGSVTVFSPWKVGNLRLPSQEAVLVSICQCSWIELEVSHFLGHEKSRVLSSCELGSWWSVLQI